MSFNGALQPTQTLCQQDFTLVNGTRVGAPIGGTIGGGGASPAGTYQNFNPQTSRIVGIKGKTLGTVAVYQNVNITNVVSTAASTLANQGLITPVSADTNDTSTYTVFWVNTIYPELSPC